MELAAMRRELVEARLELVKSREGIGKLSSPSPGVDPLTTKAARSPPLYMNPLDASGMRKQPQTTIL